MGPQSKTSERAILEADFDNDLICAHIRIRNSTDEKLASDLAVAFKLGSRPLTKISAPFRAYCREFCKAVWAEQDRRENVNR